MLLLLLFSFFVLILLFSKNTFQLFYENFLTQIRHTRTHKLFKSKYLDEKRIRERKTQVLHPLRKLFTLKTKKKKRKNEIEKRKGNGLK